MLSFDDVEFFEVVDDDIEWLGKTVPASLMEFGGGFSGCCCSAVMAVCSC